VHGGAPTTSTVLALVRFGCFLVLHPPGVGRYHAMKSVVGVAQIWAQLSCTLRWALVTDLGARNRADSHGALPNVGAEKQTSNARLADTPLFKQGRRDITSPISVLADRSSSV
jgi:hypothetical protein